jgi:hypothetical protein
MTHGEQEAEAVRERGRRARDATMFERQLVEWRLKAAREDRPPIDRAVRIRRERRRGAAAMIGWFGGSVWVFGLERRPLFMIGAIALVAIAILKFGHAIVPPRRPLWARPSGRRGRAPKATAGDRR